MELKDFVSQTLSEIVEGVRNAEKTLKDDVAVCAHTNGEYSGYPSVSYTSSLKTRTAPLSVVSFKVQVQVSEEMSVNGSVKTNILNVAGTAVNGADTTGNSLLHEVSFSIPLAWKERQGR